MLRNQILQHELFLQHWSLLLHFFAAFTASPVIIVKGTVSGSHGLLHLLLFFIFVFFPLVSGMIHF